MTEVFLKNILAEELFQNRICESIDQQYIVDKLYKDLLLERLLFGEPVTVPELRKILRNKIVNFEFIKLNGEVRPARGTTMMKYIPQKDHPKGIRPSSPKVATFFDMKKKEWRSVSQRSKEIVLDKDEATGKPIVKVTDKGAEPKEKEPIEKEPVEAPTRELKIGDVHPFTKSKTIKYKSGDKKKIQVPTFITITRKTEDGYWGKTAGSDLDILLTPERMERLEDPIQVGDTYQFAKLDKNRKKVFTTITITRKTDEGYWGKTEGSTKDILLTNERLKRLHKYVEDEELPTEEPKVPETPPVEPEPEITINGEAPEEFMEEPEKQEKQPFGTIDGMPAKPLEDPLVNVEPVFSPEGPISEPEEKEIEKEKGLPKIKPIEKGTIEKAFHFRNKTNNAALDLNISPKDTIKKLKQLGKNWHLITDKEYQEEQDKIKEKETNIEIPSKILPPKVSEKKLKKPIIDNRKKNLGNIEADKL